SLRLRVPRRQAMQSAPAPAPAGALRRRVALRATRWFGTPSRACGTTRPGARTAMIVEVEPRTDPTLRRRHPLVLVQVHLLVLEASPQSFHEDVVVGSSDARHADPHPRILQHLREAGGGELAPAVAVEDLRRAQRQ